MGESETGSFMKEVSDAPHSQMAIIFLAFKMIDIELESLECIISKKLPNSDSYKVSKSPWKN